MLCKRARSPQALAWITFGIAALAAGCSRQAFNVGSIDEGLAGPGTYEVPAKVDIILAEDDTGSMFEVYSQISSQIPGLMDKLEANGWDYHLATVPLTTSRPLTQILTSKFDGNWALNGLNKFKEPFPGASPSTPGMSVLASFFRTLTQYTDFISLSNVSNSNNQYEPGFITLQDFLNRPELVTSKFLRPDALLMILVVSNGNDSSGVAFCTRPDGWTGPCELAGFPQQGTQESSYQSYKNFFNQLPNRGLTRGVRLYSAVAAQRQSACLGAPAFAGERYQRMAADLNGLSYDVCSNPISTITEGMAQHLTNLRKEFRQRYLMIAYEPKIETLRVIKYPSGNQNQPIELPNDAENGWTYVGNQTVYQIDSPIEMNQATGFAVELHGSAKLLGNDTADVLYDPAGATPAAEP